SSCDLRAKYALYTLSLHDALPIYKYVFTTVWLPEGTCSDNNCQSLDSLASGDYTVTAYFTYTNSANFVRKDSAKTIITIKPGLRSEEHTSELQSRENLVCRLLLEK